MKNIVSYVVVGTVLSSCGVKHETNNSQLLDDIKQDKTVEYQVTFTSLWNAREHVSFPNNAHFSPIVAYSHSDGATLFQLGTLASTEFESLAETGATDGVNSILNSFEKRGLVGDRIETDSLYPKRTGPNLTFTFKATKQATSFSLATMIAPSPDWVVGLSNLNLIDEEGQFIKTYSKNLYAINAGTEQGDFGGNYTTRNRAEPVHKELQFLSGRGFNAPFAKIKLERIN